MKNVVNILLRDLYHKVPSEVLTEAFRNKMIQTNRNIDALIREYVIEDIVLMNCNLYAGKQKKITLFENYGKNINDAILNVALTGGYGVYTIPPEAREFRAITAVLDIAFPTIMSPYGVYPTNYSAGRSVAGTIDETLNSFTKTNAFVTPQPLLIDGDAGIIQLQPPAALHVDWVLSCTLAFDREFSNISPNFIGPLKQMVEFATKAFIYNELFIKLNQGQLVGGLQLEAIKSIVESYVDANEKFEEVLMDFRGAATFSPETFKHYISLML